MSSGALRAAWEAAQKPDSPLRKAWEDAQRSPSMLPQSERIKRNIAAMRQQGATDDDVEAYLVQREGLKPDGDKPQFDNALTQTRPPAKSESLKDAVTGMSQGASFNFGDEIAAGTMAALGQLFGAKLPLKESYKKLHGEAEGEVKAAGERSPFLSTTGNIAGALGAGAAGGATAEALGFSRGASEVPATIKQFLMRKGRDLAVGAGSGAIAGAGAGEDGHRLESAGEGALFGGGLVAGGQAAGGAVKATGLPALARNILPRAENNASKVGQVAEKLGVGSHQQIAIEDLLSDIRRSGMSVTDYLERAKNNPNAALYDLGPSMNTTLGSVRAKVNPQGDPLVRRARGVQSVPSRGSSMISDFTNQRAESRPGDVKDALQQGLGVGRENTVAREAELTAQRSAASGPKYDAAYASPDIEDPDVLSLLKLPAFREAYNRGRRIARIEGQKFPTSRAIARGSEPVPIRDKQGRLLADLSNVTADDLDAEVRRLSQLNAEEEAYHASVKDAGYRHDYEELPDAERTGRSKRTTDAFGNKIKRQAEDLPDADGAMDPDKLASDNKIVKDYNRAQVVRKARDKAIQRIESELNGRDASFNFGANADEGFDYYGGDATPPAPKARKGLPVQGFDYIKRGLDDLIESKMASGTMGRTEARALRNRLREAMDRVDEVNPAYREARSTFADASKEIEASQLGNDFLKTRGDELEVKFPTLSPAAQQEYRKTALAAIEERLGSGMNPAQLLNEVNARKLRLLAPSPEAYAEFEKKLRMSLQGGANDAMIMGGSPTARILAEQGDAGDGAHAISAAMQASTGNLRGLMDRVLQTGAAQRVRGLNETKVDQMAPFLTAKGTDLVYRLELMQQIEKALGEMMSQRGIRNARVGGQIGGTMAGKP